MGRDVPHAGEDPVNGRHAHPLYRALHEVPDDAGKAGRITWNFEKFLVAPDGRARRFRPRVLPDAPEVVAAIEELLPERTPGA